MKRIFTAFYLSALFWAAHAAASTAITLEDFKLVGDLTSERAAFTLSATAHVEDAKGGSVELLSGGVALTEVTSHPQWRVRVEPDRYVAHFDHRGKFPILLKFGAAVRRSNEWSAVEFRVATGAMERIALRGLSTNTEFDF